MKIDKIIDNDKNKDLTELSAYAIILLICKRINNYQLSDDRQIIDNIFLGYDYHIDYDKYIEIADNYNDKSMITK